MKTESLHGKVNVFTDLKQNWLNFIRCNLIGSFKVAVAALWLEGQLNGFGLQYCNLKQQLQCSIFWASKVNLPDLQCERKENIHILVT